MERRRHRELGVSLQQKAAPRLPLERLHEEVTDGQKHKVPLRPNCRMRRRTNESVNQVAAAEFGRESGVPFGSEAQVKRPSCATCFRFISPVFTKSSDQ